MGSDVARLAHRREDTGEVKVRMRARKMHIVREVGMGACVCVCVEVSQIFIDFGTVWPCISILDAGRKYLYSQFLLLCGKFIFLHYSIIRIEMACV